MRRGARLADHAFGWGQLVYACEGVGRVETADQHWTLPTARALWVPPEVRHVLWCTTDLELRTLYFPPAGLPHLPADCTVLVVEPLLRELILRAVVLGAADLQAERSMRLIRVLRDELAEADHENLHLPLPADARARTVALSLLETTSSRSSLDAQCARAGASRRTIERLFRSETGTSLGAWARLARLHSALRRLGQGEAVRDVAGAAGYESASAFVAAFRRTFGRTPGRYYSRGGSETSRPRGHRAGPARARPRGLRRSGIAPRRRGLREWP